MHWPEVVFVCVVVVAVLGAILADVFLLGWVIRKVRGGRTGDWQLRCTRCGRTRGADEPGLVRLGAASAGKYTLGYCAGCGERLRVIAIERKPTTPVAPIPPTPPSSAAAGGGRA